MLTIGCHLSSSKGYLAMAKDAYSIGANTFQFFTRNPRGGKAKEIDPQDIRAFEEYAREVGIVKILAHAPYTLNAASAKESTREFASMVFKDDLVRMENTPHQMYNFHPGSHTTLSLEQGIQCVVDLLNEVLEPQQTTTVLLETMSGKGTEIGRSFKELRAILDGVRLDGHVGVCLDTCHIWDAGYDIVNDLDGVLDEFDRIIGLDRLKAIHINDSLNECGAHKDRHAAIGKGKIGTNALVCVINHDRLCDLPFYLETPHDSLEGYAQEIELLKSFYNA